MAEWMFYPWDTSGGSPATSHRGHLAGMGLGLYESFAREAIQNSDDATKGSDTHVRFDLSTIDGEQKIELLRTLQMEGGLMGGIGYIAGEFANPGQHLDLLKVEDFGEGLGGIEAAGLSSEPEDNFVRLCRDVGHTRREEDQGGGSYGFGKSVYWGASKLWTVAIYSRFEPTDRTCGVSRRLFSVGWHDPLTRQGSELLLTGVCAFGARGRHHVPVSLVEADSEWPGSNYVAPLTNDEADDVAGRLGFGVRSDSQTGTSILILGSTLSDPSRLRKAIEMNWWPRLTQGSMSIQMTQSGQELPPPRADGPDTCAVLTPYTYAYERLYEGKPDNGSQVFDIRVKTPLGEGEDLGRPAVKKLATLSCRVLDDEEADNLADEEVLVGSIALVREPGMVVQYLEYKPYPTPYVAVLQAEDWVNGILRASENPAHTQWDHRSQRLGGGERAVVVKKLVASAKDHVRGFLRTNQPPPPPSGGKWDHLGRLLGGLFSGWGVGPKPPLPPSDRPVSIRYEDGPRVLDGDGFQYLFARVQISPNEDAFPEGVDELVVEISPSARAVVDEDAVRGESVDSLIYRKGSGVARGESEVLSLVRGGPPCTLDFQSYRLPDPEWVWDYRVEVEVLLDE